MSKLIYISFLLVLISAVNCENKANQEDAYDKLDKTRKGHLLTLDDCFSLFIGKTIGTIVYDGNSKPLKDVKIVKGSCLEDKDEEKGPDGKQITISKVASIQMDFSIDGIENLSKVTIDLSTKLDLKTGTWNLAEKTVTGNSKDGKVAKLNLEVDHLEAPSNYSFSCSKFVLTKSFYKNDVPDKDDSFEKKFNRIIFDDFQIQPFKGDLFNDSYDCSTWFTIGTFSGLIFLILFTSILAIGILYIMNIKSNDRFEDPKGKPLNIGLTDN